MGNCTGHIHSIKLLKYITLNWLASNQNQNQGVPPLDLPWEQDDHPIVALSWKDIRK